MTDQGILYIIPAYNEEKTVGDIVEEVNRRRGESSELIVVNDGSTDNTREEAEEAGAKVINHPINLGGGAAYRTGYKYAVREGFDYTLTIDADGQHDPDYIDDVLDPVLNRDADLCIGSRFAGSKEYEEPFLRFLGNKTFAMITSLLSHQKITDATSGFRATDRELFQYFAENYPDSFYAIEATIWSARHGFKVEEVPVKMYERENGSSYLTPIRMAKYPIKMAYSILRAL